MRLIYEWASEIDDFRLLAAYADTEAAERDAAARRAATSDSMSGICSEPSLWDLVEGYRRGGAYAAQIEAIVFPGISIDLVGGHAEITVFGQLYRQPLDRLADSVIEAIKRDDKGCALWCGAVSDLEATSGEPFADGGGPLTDRASLVGERGRELVLWQPRGDGAHVIGTGLDLQ